MPALVSCGYPVGKEHRFDLDYYKNTFMPKAFNLYEPMGMSGYEIIEYKPRKGQESPWSVQVYMYWTSVDHFNAAMENGGHDLDAEIMVYSDVDPDTISGDIAANAV